jgi:hypothetical protein
VSGVLETAVGVPNGGFEIKDAPVTRDFSVAIALANSRAEESVLISAFTWITCNKKMLKRRAIDIAAIPGFIWRPPFKPGFVWVTLVSKKFIDTPLILIKVCMGKLET